MTNNFHSLDTSSSTSSNTGHDSEDVLIEIGCEELPPTSLLTLSNAFKDLFQTELKDAGIEYQSISAYATPRRLALLINAVAAQEPNRIQERKGPPVTNAIVDNQPSKALQGFAQSCGVSISELSIMNTEKGTWYYYQQHIQGKPTPTLLPLMIERTLSRLPIAKRMRWADHAFEFVRPIRWLLALWGKQSIPMTLMGVSAAQVTYGHRFHHPNAIVITHPQDYVSLLRKTGHVIADFTERQQLIVEQIQQQASAYGTAVISDELLAEVTALTEYPIALLGQFEQRFLDVPQEALISTMQDNQKYFPIVNHDGILQPYFIFVTNLISHDPSAVIAGNERVIRPRFSDAEFFWKTDRQHPLASHVPALKRIIFQSQLGTQADKVSRVMQLSNIIAEKIGANLEYTARAATLYKCDLVTNMVQEFPELQGIMGRYYALHDNEHPIVAQAIEQSYWPRFAGDHLPNTPEAISLAIAERLDTIVSIFAIGQIPSGSKDPYSLRRNAVGVLRMIIEAQYDLNLRTLIAHSAQTMPTSVTATSIESNVLTYILERMKAYVIDLGIPIDSFDAVMSLHPSRPLDMMKRLHALTNFREQPQAHSLVNANKRIQNILRRNATPLSMVADPALYQDPAEIALFDQAQIIHETLSSLLNTQAYTEILNQLCTLAQPLEQFFNDVMVMCEDETLRHNRLALLSFLQTMFQTVADLSVLQLDNK